MMDFLAAYLEKLDRMVMGEGEGGGLCGLLGLSTSVDPEEHAILREAERRAYMDRCLSEAISEDGNIIAPLPLSFWVDQVRAERAPKVTRQQRRFLARKGAR